MLRRHRSNVELLPHDLVELILERLPVESLLRLKSVSKKWKSTIDSRRFQERQLILRRQYRGPDVLFVRLTFRGDKVWKEDVATFVLGSSIARTVRFPNLCTTFCYGSCDGLVCLYCFKNPSVVVNPATGWQRTFPLSTYQHLLIHKCKRKEPDYPFPKLGFGRDKFKGTYKPVWLYNSSEYGQDNVTTCEVFDFSTNAWRYVVPASPYRINACHKPVYLDGSLYWFTECEEPKVLSFDLHTETFQVVCKAPFAPMCDPTQLAMCILDNCLCVSEKNWPIQVIWSFDSSSGSNVWKKMYTIDLTKTLSWFGESEFALLPIAIVDKNKLLLRGRDPSEPMVVHDLYTKSYDLLFKPTIPVGSVYYFQSLFSTLPN